MGRDKNLKRRLLKVILIIVLASLFLEGAARIFHTSDLSGALFDFHPVFGHLSVTGHYASRIERSEPYFPVDINREGFRDDDHAKSKSQNTFRIAVLGDSFVEAIQVPREQSSTFLLQQELARLHSSQMELLNFGTNGFGTLQEYLVLKNMALSYNPDLVVLVFCVNNDVSDNAAGVFPHRLPSPEPYAEMIGEKLVIHPPTDRRTTLEKIVLFCWERFHFYSHFYRSWKLLLANLRFHLHPLLHAHRYDNPFSEEFVFSDPYSSEWSQAWDITKRLILDMKSLCDEHGVKFALVVTDAGEIQVNPNLHLERVRQQVLFKKVTGKNLDFNKPERILEKFSEEHDVPFLVLSRELERYSQRTGQRVHFSKDQHWNSAGHQAVAEAVQTFLDTAKLLPDR